MPSSIFAGLLALAALGRAQQVGTNQAENHPQLSWQTCTGNGACSNQNGQVVLDSNWRWVHNNGGFDNCYTGNTWDTTLCPNNQQCAQNCALDGADYPGVYGVQSSGDALTLRFVTQSEGRNIGSRLYLMENESRYQMFSLLNQEFTFDVDVSQLPCGLNGALYFVAMDADGGTSRFSGNTAGARYGTGYCDAQCPSDLKFINGEANVEGWNPSGNDENAGNGNFGSCCPEMDIWEANSISTAFTPHPCTNNNQQRCSGEECGGTFANDRYAGSCDPDGCDFNSYRQGNTTFFGPGQTVDTNRPITVVTQFITQGNSANGALTEIRRFYVQNGQTIPNSQSSITNNPGNSITEGFCDAQKQAFGDRNVFSERGGLAAMGNAMRNGMVLVMSLWDDHAVNMLWLDSQFPTDADPNAPGVARGTCSRTSGAPTDVENQSPNSQVTFSNIRFGPIGSTT